MVEISNIRSKHTNSLISLFSLCGMRKTSTLFLLSLRPLAPTLLVLVCAFFMFFIQSLCIRLVLEFLVFALIPSN